MRTRLEVCQKVAWNWEIAFLRCLPEADSELDSEFDSAVCALTAGLGGGGSYN